jgi:DNA-binding HxlR family transcriptional regulator
MKIRGYGQYCPVAKTAAVVSGRWTLLILRDFVLRGTRRYNELKRGNPLIPPSVLAQRLKSLEYAKIIARERSAHGNTWEYHLTEAGEELRPLIEAAGHWGQRWLGSTLTRNDVTPSVLMWDIKRKLRCNELPPDRTVICVEFTDLKRMRFWWLVVEEGNADICMENPGHDVDITIYADLLSLTQVFLGSMSISRALSEGKVRTSGRRELTKSISRWFGVSMFADDNPLNRTG